MPNISIWEILLLLLVLLLVFGPKRLPEMGRSLGRGMREFKDSITGNRKADEEDDEDEVAAIASPAVTAPAAEPTATVAPPESKPLS